jgi:putative endonuclease
MRCADGTLYTGVTNNLPQRLKQHNAGQGSRYTRSRLPVQLAYSEPAKNRSQAQQREAAIKRLTRRDKLALIKQ